MDGRIPGRSGRQRAYEAQSNVNGVSLFEEKAHGGDRHINRDCNVSLIRSLEIYMSISAVELTLNLYSIALLNAVPINRNRHRIQYLIEHHPPS